MRITSIRLYSPVALVSSDVNETPVLDLVLQDFSSDEPYIIKNATGLDAPDLIDTSRVQSVMNNFGAVEPRIIDLLVTLNPYNSLGKTISELRDDLYKIIHGGNYKNIDIRFFDKYTIGEVEGGSSVARLTGVITKIDTSLFDKKSEVIITLRCEQPLIKAYTQVDGYENRVVNELDDNIIFFTDDVSTAPHGLEILVTWPYDAYRIAEDFNFVLTTNHANGISSTFSLPLGITSVQGGSLYVNTNFNAFEVTRGISTGGSAGSSESALRLLEDGFEWPIVVPGDNDFYLEESDKFDVISFTHTPTFWGV